MRAPFGVAAMAVLGMALALGSAAAPALDSGAAGPGRWGPSSLPASAGEVTGIAVSPRAPKTVLTSTLRRGVFKSSDGGRTWRKVVGLQGQRLWTLAFDPQTPSTVYAGVTGGVSTSRDGGRRWSEVVRCCGIEVFAFAFDPIDSQVVFAGGDGVSKSVDGGRTWQRASEGVGGLHVNSLAVDPRSPQTVYAGAGGGGAGPMSPKPEGVYRTTNGGETWRRVGLGGRSVVALTLDPREPSIVYGATQDHGVYKSVDTGRTWQRASAGLDDCQLTALVIDPGNPRTLYAGTAWNPQKRRYCGVFRSTDAALTWSAFNDGLTDLRVLELAISSNGRALYAGTLGGRVFAQLVRVAPVGR